MFRQAILGVFLCGLISSQELLLPAIEKTDDFNVEINGNLSIQSAINTDNEIAHQQLEYEPLKLVKNVDGILHYSIGARTSSEYRMF